MMTMAMSDNGEALLTANEAAELLGVSTQTLRRYRAEGLIKTVKFSTRSIRIKRSQVDAFIKAHDEDKGGST